MRSYILLIEVRRNCSIEVGKRCFQFEPGLYCYVGSCKKLARVRRHFQSKKKKKWHVDYLLSSPHSEVKGVFLIKAKECELADRMKGKPIPGFGCSDCKCATHLYKFEDFEEALRQLHELRHFYPE